MNAEKLEDWELEMWDEELCCDLSQSSGVGANAKRALESNVKFILLGAVPFAADVPRLKKLGVGGIVTLNESYETLVPTLLYHAHSIDHLVIPTRDYLFAPSLNDTCRAVDFIYSNASLGRTTYVHCKAGRGRSTTIVLCYLVEHKQMTPDAAYSYVKSIRPRVVLASAQWKVPSGFQPQEVLLLLIIMVYTILQIISSIYNLCLEQFLCFLTGITHSCATLNCNSIRYNPKWGNFFFPSSLLVDYKMQAVQDYYLQKVKKTKSSGCINNRVRKSPFFPSKQYAVAFDDDSIDIVTESDLDGYESYGTSCDSIIMVTQSELDGYDSSWQETARKKLRSSVAEIEVFERSFLPTMVGTYTFERKAESSCRRRGQFRGQHPPLAFMSILSSTYTCFYFDTH
ncbi:hypothetical protein AAG906_007900 [Vitis piasezkii]